MNKCHYYLSRGLWEVVKCYFDNASNPSYVYFWGMAVAPHHTCFASHIISTPWQQSWATLKLLEDSIKTGNKTDVYSIDDIVSARQEIDFQYTLRNYASDDFVKTLFEFFGKFVQHGSCPDWESEEVLQSLQQFFILLLNDSPPTAHCLTRQMQFLLPKLLDLSIEHEELTSLLIGAVPDIPSHPRLLPFYAGRCDKKLLLMLLANLQATFLRKIELEEKQSILDSSLTQLQSLLVHGIQPMKLFNAMILTNRHFVLYLLDLIELGLTLTNTESVPKFLWPLMLLRLWGKPEISEFQIQSLIDQCKKSTNDQAMLRVCFMLEWFISFSRWSASQGSDKKVELEAAREHSVLRLIHTSADLAHADWGQVKALLHEPWDLMLFDGFCAQIILLRAMSAAATMRRDRVPFAEAAQAEQRLAKTYQLEVLNPLQEIRKLVQFLKPLRFRLEILENLFGLLFVTWEDLQGVQLGRRTQKEQHSPSIVKNSATCHGFICSPHFLRDAVLLIKECTADLEREPKTEQEVSIPCSIEQTQVEKRLDRLIDSVNEATLRLQLVTSSEFVTDTGSVDYTHERYDFEADFFVQMWTEQGKSKRRVGQEKREESGTQSPASGGEGDKNSEKPSGPGFMHQMLSSDSSLVMRCLSKGDLLNAKHIITMMSTEESQQVLEGELNFTQALIDIRQKLRGLGKASLQKPNEGATKSPRKSSGLQAIQQVAEQGLLATAVTSHVERFLSATTLPNIQGASAQSLGIHLACIENSAASVTIDLAMTAAMTYQDYRDLFNLAGKHCPELNTRLPYPLGTSGSAKIFGYVQFSQTLMSLLHELSKGESIAPATFFRTRQVSFVLKTLKEQEQLWKLLQAYQNEVENSRRESKTIGKDLARGQRNIKNMQKILENIKKIGDSSMDILELGRNEISANEAAKIVNYSELLNRYLSDLAGLSMDFIAYKSDCEDVVTFHNLLEHSAIEILDRLVFKYQVDPAVLEKKAQQLGFNLCASLLWGCCPPIPQGLDFPDPDGHAIPDCVILNLPSPKFVMETVEDVSELIASILEQMKEILKTYASNDSQKTCEQHVSFNALANASMDERIVILLQRTQSLAVLDMPSLPDFVSFQFFANLLNLLTLHCFLSPMICDLYRLKDGLIRSTAVHFVGYQLGGIGFVSLADLEYALFGELISSQFTSPVSALPRIESDLRAVFFFPFLMGFYSAPRLHVVTTELFNVQASDLIESYASRYVTKVGNRLRIPGLLDWYLNKLVLTEPLEVTESLITPKQRTQRLLEFLAAHCDSDKWREILTSWQQSDLVLEVDDKKCSRPCFQMNYCEHEHITDWPVEEAPKRSTTRWETRQISEAIIKQLSQSSRVLADVVIRLYDARGDSEARGLEMGHDVLLDEKLRVFDSLLASSWINSLAPLFNNNIVLAALHKSPPHDALWNYLQKCVDGQQWEQCWTLIQALPDFMLLSDGNLRRFRDLVLLELTNRYSQSPDGQGWMYAQQISDLNTRIRSIKKNHSFWPGPVAIKLLSATIRDESTLTKRQIDELETMIQSATVFTNIIESCQEFELKTWHEIAMLTTSSPNTVLQILLNTQNLQLFLDWMSLPKVINLVIPLIEAEHVLQFATLSPRKLDTLFAMLPHQRVLALCEEIIPQLPSLSVLRSITELCLQICDDESSKLNYRKMWFGVELFSVLEKKEQVLLSHLVAEPLLAIEQLIMNTRLDSVSIILRKLKQLPSRDIITDEDICNLLTRYASRALELNVIRVVQPARETFLVLPPSTVDYVVPQEVPDKSQWVPDNQVRLCMRCSLVSFSMFNRRHHCRRCGRVVCAACSPNRIVLDLDKGVSVRVCKTCHAHQSSCKGDELKSGNSQIESTAQTEDAQYWRLTTDLAGNCVIREEFSYEHSPNASLCLAIFNLLPMSATYTSLLLDESEKLLELLQSKDTASNPEIDYTVLITIIRALVVGAKVRYGQGGFPTGMASCDQLLSHVDVISLLVRKHCIRLIPQEQLVPKIMRALRDRLIEEELWDLAIELSTKAGLSVKSVWAAWGKVLLAAGCWAEARQKFAQCLSTSTHHSRSSPLVDDICKILDSTTFSTFRSNGSAQEVLEILSTLKGLASGKYPTKNNNGPGSPQFIEQEWYLIRYGSVAGLIKFYLRHDQWDAVLGLLRQRQLEPELFIDSILIPAYRSNTQDRLKTEIMTADPTLETFERYLTTSCLHLQKTQSYYYLHDVQLFMHDYVRAAMTCIHLYQSNGSSFSRQCELADLLQTALRHLEEEISATSKKTRRLENVMRMDYRELNRHMNTIWRQLEVAKYLAGCETSTQDFATLLKNLSWNQQLVPTLFDKDARVTLAVISVLAGKNVEEGFGLAYRIIQDYGLDQSEVYTYLGTNLGRNGRAGDLQQLVDCIKTSGAEDTSIPRNKLLSAGIEAMAAANQLQNVDALFPLITSVDLRITAFIQAKQLKAAYLLAVKHNQINAIQKIMEEAEKLGQTVIKEFCRKKLGLSGDSLSTCSSVPSHESVASKMMSRITTMINENPLSMSWHDSAWVPLLNPTNVMDYFAERSNPFYDRSCNNEIVKMQRLSMDQLTNMTGVEYVLLHVQEPILYVIRKQHRHSPGQVTPLAEYYIVAGTIYQAPDLNSVLNSRLLNCTHHLQSALEEASSYSRYHPSKGYSWDFKDRKVERKEKKEIKKVDPSSNFQRQRVDMLLGELVRKFPPPKPTGPVAPPVEQENVVRVEEKAEKPSPAPAKNMKPPPDKKPKLS